MNRIISALVLLGMSLGMCVYAAVATEERCLQLKNDLDSLERVIVEGNSRDALIIVKKLEDNWKKSEILFSSLSESALIDEINITLLSLEEHILTEKKQEIIILITQCRNALEIISQRQKITADNIL